MFQKLDVNIPKENFIPLKSRNLGKGLANTFTRRSHGFICKQVGLTLL